MTDRLTLERRIDQGAGRTAADLVVKNVRLFDLVTGELVPTDIAICDSVVVATYGTFRGAREVDGRGRIAVPGFIDTHLHVESSLMTPAEFDRVVTPHGVTTAVCDPHEIGNVLGVPGIEWVLESASRAVMDLRVALSSCVPATHMETAGARLEAADLAPLRAHPKVIGLAEVMNFPGVIHKDPGVMEKLALFSDGHMDGHAPLLRGADLNAYLAAGIRTDHETTGPDEALEKIRKGMTVLIREGSVCKDLHALAPLLTVQTAPFFAFCTDDRNPLEVAREGHIDFLIREAISLGVSPLAAYRTASLSGAQAFGLRDRGLIAPGWRADIALLDDLADCRVSDVIAGGRRVEPELFDARRIPAPVGLASVKARPVTAADFRVPASGPTGPVMGILPGKILTEHLRLSLPYRNGERFIDLAQDVAKVAVVARHGVNTNIGRAFVTGMGLTRGAIASSVGHDSHNLCVIGVDDGDMAVAINRLIELGGGFVVVEGGRVLADLPLPVAGLMSLADGDTIAAGLGPLRAAAASLGTTLAEPFLQMAFLPLPVIPHLKITDMGLVDVDRFELIAA